MKEIILIDNGMDKKTTITIGEYNFVFRISNVRKSEVESKVGSLHNYAHAVYNLLVNDDITELVKLGYVFYTMNDIDSDLISSSLEYVELFNPGNKTFNELYENIKNPKFCCCKELLTKLFTMAKSAMNQQEEVSNPVSENTEIIETTAKVVEEEKPCDTTVSETPQNSESISEPTPEPKPETTEEQKKAREERMKRIDAYLA